MTLINNSKARKGKIKSVVSGGKIDRRIPYARKGWMDAINGEAIDYKFLDDAGTKHVCFAETYENWRLRALALMRSGVKCPAWNTDKGMPPKVSAALTVLVSMDRAERDHAAQQNEDYLSCMPRGKKNWLAPIMGLEIAPEVNNFSSVY